ncbi:nucleotidyltransferase domain-containing protein [Acidiferrimicrobium sp. IK]|uniref:nucleotidyltransferase domain-containing protein n=1 Tax=Acidiferrimicrobium sp. IK TaxID=2871700 RepID=UPI0021CB262D|nr:nucleotidyltransferase domain-containing protein [Acidiferrimicrobium sp. IK]MCU4187223.1 nucleotidyltransferase domain-containing protein [Acidiferrimicrobium sp. IK]
MLEIPPLPGGTILLVEVGSTAHGTGLPGGEDLDQLGVVVESAEEVLGLGETGMRSVMQRTQPEGSRSGPGDIDRTLHSLRRFLRLAGSGNPSILMALWAPVFHATDQGRQLQALGPKFVGRHIVPRYRGYMRAQAERLLGIRGRGHGQRGGGGRLELIEEFGYDTKYAMHCARLGFQCLELLTTGHLNLPIQGEPARWLLDVRHGRVPFDDWWRRSLELDATLATFTDDTSIPPAVDRSAIERWSVDTHLHVWADAR